MLWAWGWREVWSMRARFGVGGTRDVGLMVFMFVGGGRDCMIPRPRAAEISAPGLKGFDREGER